MTYSVLALTLVAGLGVPIVLSAVTGTVPGGTEIVVRTDALIDARTSSERNYTATVAEDIADRDGNVLIPRGSRANLVVRAAGDDELVLDLDSVVVNGRRHTVTADSLEREQREGVGKNKRTGKYVGGGAALGGIIGAIAGGGKGAAIGAAVGAAGGAGAQTLTRGKNVRVPAESKLTFRLADAVEIRPAAASRARRYRY